MASLSTPVDDARTDLERTCQMIRRQIEETQAVLNSIKPGPESELKEEGFSFPSLRRQWNMKVLAELNAALIKLEGEAPSPIGSAHPLPLPATPPRRLPRLAAMEVLLAQIADLQERTNDRLRVLEELLSNPVISDLTAASLDRLQIPERSLTLSSAQHILSLREWLPFCEIRLRFQYHDELPLSFKAKDCLSPVMNSPTLIIIRSGACIFGGFTSIRWSPRLPYTDDPTSWLFCLTSDAGFLQGLPPIRFLPSFQETRMNDERTRNVTAAVSMMDLNDGPGFGYKFLDLMLTTERNRSYTKIGSRYHPELPPSLPLTPLQRESLSSGRCFGLTPGNPDSDGGVYRFQPDVIEIFSVYPTTNSV